MLGIVIVVPILVYTLLLPRAWRPINTYSVASVGMAPSLMLGDYVTTWWIDPAKVTRGTIIVVRMGRDHYLKRVVGLPGDTVALRGGVVYLNGKAIEQLPLGPGPKGVATDPEMTGTPKTSAERLPGESNAHQILDFGLMPDRDDFPAVVVPAKSLFVLGDNRDNSGDSRFPREEGGPTGMVVFADVEGRVTGIFWSKDFARIGKPIDIPAPVPAR